MHDLLGSFLRPYLRLIHTVQLYQKGGQSYTKKWQNIYLKDFSYSFSSLVIFLMERFLADQQFISHDTQAPNIHGCFAAIKQGLGTYIWTIKLVNRLFCILSVFEAWNLAAVTYDPNVIWLEASMNNIIEMNFL